MIRVLSPANEAERSRNFGDCIQPGPGELGKWIGEEPAAEHKQHKSPGLIRSSGCNSGAISSDLGKLTRSRAACRAGDRSTVRLMGAAMLRVFADDRWMDREDGEQIQSWMEPLDDGPSISSPRGGQVPGIAATVGPRRGARVYIRTWQSTASRSIHGRPASGTAGVVRGSRKPSWRRPVSIASRLFSLPIQPLGRCRLRYVLVEIRYSSRRSSSESTVLARAKPTFPVP